MEHSVLNGISVSNPSPKGSENSVEEELEIIELERVRTPSKQGCLTQQDWHTYELTDYGRLHAQDLCRSKPDDSEE